MKIETLISRDTATISLFATPEEGGRPGRHAGGRFL
jgi:hypothetical protein